MVKASLVAGIILIVIGLFYAGAPHDIHLSSGAGFGWDHTMHIALGIVLIIIGLAIILALRGKKNQKAAAPKQPKESK